MKSMKLKWKTYENEMELFNHRSPFFLHLFK
jgi:hypothetical protein